METEIIDVDHNNYVNMLGTAHFTRRSLLEAYDTVRNLKPTDLAIELDIHRFQLLSSRCVHCSKRLGCAGRCEFVGATDALGNVDANIWLIDMSEREISTRVRSLTPPSRFWLSFADFPFTRRVDNEVWLWEKGFKDEVMNRHEKRLEVLRARAPHVWRVLIDERNALMAARLAWIVTQKLDKGNSIEVLALTGAAHVNGIRKLLSSPSLIREELIRYGIKFTPPTLIKRVSVN